MEARLRSAWCQVLDYEEDDDELNSDSHFFQAGGDSVAAMRLIGLAEGFHIRLDNSTIYDFPILKNMACNSEDLDTTPDTSISDATAQTLEEELVQACMKTCRVERGVIEDIFPAIEGQARLLAWHMKDGSAMLQYVFQIHGPAQKTLIREVVDVIQQKNQILRTRIVRHKDALHQVVVKDTAEWYEGTNLLEYQDLVFSRDGWVGYGDPLFRYAFIEEGRNLYFAYTSQHCGYDGWTNHLFFDALEEGLRDLEVLQQKPVQTQFKQFSKWLEQRSAAKDEIAKSMTFWESYLAGFQSFATGFDVAPDHTSYETARLTKIMPLRRRASKFALSTMAHAAWAISLGNIYQHDDILFSSVSSGRRFPRDRPLPGAESVMGPLNIGTNLRTKLRAEQSIEELLQDTQDDILSMIPYQRESPKARAEILGPHVKYLSIFNWHPIGNDIPARIIDFENPDGSITRLEGRRDLYRPFTVPIPIVIDVWEHHDHLRIIAKWDEKLYDERRVTCMLDQLTGNLSKVAASKADRVGDLWAISDLSNRRPAEGPVANDRETSLAAQETLVDSSLPGTDDGDTMSTEVLEGSTSFTPATTDLSTPVEHLSNASASLKAATPILDIPHSNSTVRVSIINTTSFVRDIPVPVFLQPSYKGFDKIDIPVYSFLIEHLQSGRKALFDLGIRKDWENLSPAVVDRIKEIGMTIDVKDSITNILQGGGVDPNDISSVIWSHSHWDHIGDPSLFPSTTDLIVGPGFKDSLLPGYPENIQSQIRSSDYHGRKAKEVSFDADTTTIGGFRAVDFFGDGSFYLLDSPGHTVGHISALCRTTSSAAECKRSTFVLLGGDSAHHAGIFRPSSHHPLPSSITTLAAISSPQAAGDLDRSIDIFASAHRMHPSDSAWTEPFLLPSKTHDADAFNRTLSQLQAFDASEDVLVLIAHDSALEGVVDVFPHGTANEWKEKAWKERLQWRFLRDFEGAVKATARSSLRMPK